ncbi:MAG TPA: hypothetical protein VFH68_20375 [Polyangia bacterium]|jgi:NADH:ubiquinone oxidoreductase subunit 4 (subunit M)|nr:hypothetical protein [Polyangia bacterium]
MTWFIRACAFYNASAAVVFLTPGFLPALGVKPPYSPFWLWLPSLFALFAATVLMFSAADLRRLGTFPYWNGIVRLAFVVVTFALDFGGSVGPFVRLLAIGDLALALGCIFGLPLATRRTHLQLLTNRGTT